MKNGWTSFINDSLVISFHYLIFSLTSQLDKGLAYFSFFWLWQRYLQLFLEGERPDHDTYFIVATIFKNGQAAKLKHERSLKFLFSDNRTETSQWAISGMSTNLNQFFVRDLDKKYIAQYLQYQCWLLSPES